MVLTAGDMPVQADSLEEGTLAHPTSPRRTLLHRRSRVRQFRVRRYYSGRVLALGRARFSFAIACFFARRFSALVWLTPAGG